ncbi:MAG: chaperone modulator CbpM [Solirubrobacterales bacterium]
MEYRKYDLVLRRSLKLPGLFAANDLAAETGMHPDMVETLTELGIIEPVESEPEPLYNQDALRRASAAFRLRNQLGVNWAGIALVLDLLDRIERLELENRRLKQSGF